MIINIRLAKKSDLSSYTVLLQKTYQRAYTDEALGFTKNLFSNKIFNSTDTQKYLLGNLKISKNLKTWLAFDKDKLVGSVTIEKKGTEFEMRGFYVLPKFQGKGIGKKLWQKVLSYSKEGDIVLDIYSHNNRTIELYKRWGFIIDTEKGEFFRHWPEWPEGIEAKSIYMRRKGGVK